jgi:endo-1,4-beta-xylanase
MLKFNRSLIILKCLLLCLFSIICLYPQVFAQSPTITGVVLDNGTLDRIFDPSRTLYFVELPVGTMQTPVITYTVGAGATATKTDAVNVNSSTVSDRISTIQVSDNQGNSTTYRFVFNVKINNTISISEMKFIDAGKLSIKGNLVGNKFKTVNVMLLKPKALGSNETYKLEDVTANNMENYVLDILPIPVNPDGTFIREYTFPVNVISGMYSIWIGGTNVPQESLVNRNIFYATITDINNAILDLNASNDSNVDAVIINKANILGLELSDYNTLTNKKLIWDRVIGKIGSKTMGEVQQIYNNALAVSVVNEATQNTMSTVLIKYKDILGINLIGDYALLKEHKNADLMLVKKSFVDKTLFKKAFDGAVAVCRINEAEPIAVQSIFESNKDAIGIDADLYKQYSDLSDKLPVIKDIRNQNFQSVDSFITAFKNAVELANQPTQTPTPVPTKPTTSVTVRGGGSTVVPIKDNNNTKAVAFIDIDGVSWARDAINALNEKGIVTGKKENVFAPNDKVTREEFIKMLVVALNIEAEDENATVNFEDVSKDSWYYQYIVSAYSKGIIKGLDDKLFGVGQNITRQDMSVIIFNALKQKNINLSYLNDEIAFTDKQEIADYALESVTNMQKAGLINGVGGNLFAPNDPSTRAMAAKLIYSLLQSIGNK